MPELVENYEKEISICGPGVTSPVQENILTSFQVDYSRLPKDILNHIQLGDFDCHISDEDNQQVKATIRELTEGCFEVSYIPLTRKVKIAMSFNGKELESHAISVIHEDVITAVSAQQIEAQTPLEVPIKEKIFDIRKIKVEGYGIQSDGIEVYKPADFFVDVRPGYLKNQDLLKELQIPGKIQNMLRVKALSVDFQEEKVKVKVVPNNDGRFWVRYWPNNAGCHEISVETHDQSRVFKVLASSRQ